MKSSLTLSLGPYFILAGMLALMIASSWNDSAIVDEVAHIPAGYSYLALKDARLNPEHPPLIKDIAALPLLFGDFNFPTDTKSWRDDTNGQWAQGGIFLYGAGNDTGKILRWSRLPMMLLTVFLGWLLWLWASKNFGLRVAFLTVLFYALSPTLIAHGRYVTTDIAASFGFFIGIISYLHFLKTPSAKNILLAGLAFGIAELLKFSLILLVPIYGLLALAWALAQAERPPLGRLKLFFGLALKTAAIFAIGVFVIWLAYLYHVWNYPQDRQLHDAEAILASFQSAPVRAFDLWLIEQKYLRPLGQYVLGLLMVIQRTAGGNTQYFLGTVSAAGSRIYFPTLYALKEPLAFLILAFIALAAAVQRTAGAPRKSTRAILEWIKMHFAEFAALAFIAIYWLSSVSSTLNIGVRHVLPTFPFIYLLVSRELVAWLRSWPASETKNILEWLKRVYQIYVASLPRYGFVLILILWQAISVILAFPYYLSYYNEIAGGTSDGYLVAVDSNYDWGQDLERLLDYVRERGIERFYIDYFGGGNPEYYFGDKAILWNSSKGYPPGGGLFAISATFQMGAWGTPIDNFERRLEDSYNWLKPYQMSDRAGTSIFIYRLPAVPTR